jgi:hypothetical protein
MSGAAVGEGDTDAAGVGLAAADGLGVAVGAAARGVLPPVQAVSASSRLMIIRAGTAAR